MYKLKEVLENKFLCAPAVNWPQSVMKVFSNNFLENQDFQSYNHYVINFKEHLCNNVKGHLCQTSLSLNAEWQYHNKVYNII